MAVGRVRGECHMQGVNPKVAADSLLHRIAYRGRQVTECRLSKCPYRGVDSGRELSMEEGQNGS